MTKIKICGITRPQDALAAAAAGADAMGLVFYTNSSRYVSVEQAQAIVQVLPPFISSVGLFVNPTVEYVRQVLATMPLSCLQFHGQETDEFCQQFGKPYLKAIHVREDSDVAAMIAHYPKCCGILLDTYVEGSAGGNGLKFNWHKMPQQFAKPIILAGGLTSDNVAEAIALTKPYAVDVSSGVESAPGIKSAEKINAFCQQVKPCQ